MTGAPDSFVEQVRALFVSKGISLETDASPEHEVQNSGLPVRFNAAVEIFDALPFYVLQLNNNHTLDMERGTASSTVSCGPSSTARPPHKKHVHACARICIQVQAPAPAEHTTHPLLRESERERERERVRERERDVFVVPFLYEA